MKAMEHAAIMDGVLNMGAMNKTLSQSPLVEERLPFTVRIVRSDDTLQKAVAIRQAAYARHVPEFAAELNLPEPNDHDQGSMVLLAESRMDRSSVGTMRIQTNRYRDLAIAQSVELPAWLKNRNMAEATRLAVAQGGSGRVVKLVLCKAFYLYCLAANIEWMVIAARPPLDRQYEAALFEDVYPGEFFPMRHGHNIPHRVLAFEVGTAADRWAEANHPLLKFMVQTSHPDIDLSDADFSAWGPSVYRTGVPYKIAADA
jgi:hypothetical protein